MSLKEKARKALMPFGFEATVYAGLALPLIVTGNVKTAVEVVGATYLIGTPFRYIFHDAHIELRDLKSAPLNSVVEFFYNPLDKSVKKLV